jgi:osmoprotectant transport system permease protein
MPHKRSWAPARSSCLNLLLAALLALALTSPPVTAKVVVGSKNFTEGVVLGELIRGLADSAGGEAEHRQALGGTRLVFNALVSGEIDVYAEYTGTLTHEIFAAQKPESLAALREQLAQLDLVMSEPLGFRDNFALGMRKDVAQRLGIRRISDLRDHPELVFRFGTEFTERGDGWPGLQQLYQLPQQDVLGVEHDLAYRGLAARVVDLTDLYTTDAEIAYYDLQVLADDLGYFPPYDAVLLYRSGLAESEPAALAAMLRLEGLIDERQMIAMNARVKIDGEQEQMVAADFLRARLDVSTEARETTRVQRLLRYTGQHIALVAVSLSVAILIAIPLGITLYIQPVTYRP